MLKFNFKIAWRNIRKNKVFSLINILGLALSIASCILISLYVLTEFSYDSFHGNAKNIYRITEKQDQAGTWYDVAVTPGPLAPALKKDFPAIDNIVRFGNWSGLLKHGEAVYEEKGILLTENSLFSMFNFPLLKGDKKTALLLPNEIVITESAAIRYFGKEWMNNAALLEQTFLFQNQDVFKLAGVVKDPPPNSSIQFEVLLPLQYLFSKDEWSNKWNSNNYHTYLQLNPGTDAAIFEATLKDQLAKYNNDKSTQLILQPLSRQYLYSKFAFNTDWGKRSNIKYVQIFIVVGILLLIIACVNFVNLSTARSLKRSLEVGVRKVNGASRKQLILQFLSESVLIALLAGVLAVFILRIVQPYIVLLTGKPILIEYTDPLFIVIVVIFILIIGVIAGLYPAFILSSFKPLRVLKGVIEKPGHFSVWKSLVVAQFAISITLMIATFFMYRQLQFVQQKDLGFDKSQLLNVRLKGELLTKAMLMKNELDAQTSIAASAPATMSLVNVENTTYMEWDGMKEEDKFLITQANVTPDFIPALKMQLLNGKNFSYQQTNDTSTFIINEAAVKRMGFTISSVIGKQINFWGAKGTIIGVIKDFNFKSLAADIEPFILRYQPEDRYFSMFVKTMPGKTDEAITLLQRIYKKYEKDAPLEFSFTDEAIGKLYEDDQRTARIILLFASLTVFVGCIGLFGLTVFAAESRKKEVGIRKVLGAGVASLAALLSKDFIKLIVISLVIAVPVAWILIKQWLQNFAYQIQIEWWVFVVAGCLIVMFALLTISVYVVKAAASNPVKNLRTE